jgi:nicotinamidase-related amidase
VAAGGRELSLGGGRFFAGRTLSSGLRFAFLQGMSNRNAVQAAFGMPRSRTVLLVLDMISDFDFPDGKAVLRAARRIAPRIVALKIRAAKAGIPTLYVNDNLGRWRSDLTALLAHCSREEAIGCDVVRQIAPAGKDFVLLKPRHSGFYSTPLAALLEAARAQRLILTGVSTHQCVLFTANDAYLRELELAIPSDCVGAPDPKQSRFALRYFASVLGADVRPSERVPLRR